MKVKKVVKALSKVALMGMLILLTACEKKEDMKWDSIIEEEPLNYYIGMNQANQILSDSSFSVFDSFNNNNILISYSDKLLLIESGLDRIELDSDGLRVNSNHDTVTISKEGLLVNDSTSKVDISPNGIYVEEDGSKVEITQNGISINDGISGENITIDFPLDALLDSIIGEDFSMNDVLSNAFNRKTDWFSSMNMDNVSLLDYQGVINGELIKKRIYLKDGYLITFNCDEDTTRVNGLFLDKVITDEEGNVYRYYTKESPIIRRNN